MNNSIHPQGSRIQLFISIIAVVILLFTPNMMSAQDIERPTVIRFDVHREFQKSQTIHIAIVLRVSAQGNKVLGIRERLADVRQHFLTELARSPSAAQEIHFRQHLQNIPYEFADVSSVGLDLLARNPDVVAIYKPGLLNLYGGGGWTGQTVNTPLELWFLGFKGAGSAVAIFDTGIDASLPMFNGRVSYEACYSVAGLGQQSVCHVGDTTSGAARPCTVYGCGHGTAVADVAAGDPGSSSSFSGPAAEAKILAYQVAVQVDDQSICAPDSTPCAKISSEGTLEAIDDLLSRITTFGVASANFSFGSGSFSQPCSQSVFAPAMHVLRQVGVIPVVAAGNDSQRQTIADPACVPDAVSVASVKSIFETSVSDFSDISSFTTFAIWGEGVPAVVPGGVVSKVSGTSFSAPSISGLLAALRSAVPLSTPEARVNAMIATGIPVTGTGVPIGPKIPESILAYEVLEGRTGALLSLSSTSDSLIFNMKMSAPRIIIPVAINVFNNGASRLTNIRASAAGDWLNTPVTTVAQLDGGQTLGGLVDWNDDVVATLKEGQYLGTISITADDGVNHQETSRSVMLNVLNDLPGTIAVSPENQGVRKAFPRGDNSIQYSWQGTVSNTGSTPVQVQIQSHASWLHVSPSSLFALTKGATQLVTVTLDPSTTPINQNDAETWVSFVNLTNHVGDTRRDFLFDFVQPGSGPIFQPTTDYLSFLAYIPAYPTPNQSQILLVKNVGTTTSTLSFQPDNPTQFVMTGCGGGTLASGATGACQLELSSDFISHFGIVTHMGSIRIGGVNETWIPTITTIERMMKSSLAISPVEDFVVTGHRGGPFAPATKVYLAQNTGNVANINWQITEDTHPTWLKVTGGGLLGPFTTGSASVSLDTTVAAKLVPGDYVVNLTFASTSLNGNSIGTRAILHIIP